MLGALALRQISGDCFEKVTSQESLYYQPKQCTVIGEIPQNYHMFALFDPSKMGNLKTPASSMEQTAVLPILTAASRSKWLFDISWCTLSSVKLVKLAFSLSIHV